MQINIIMRLKLERGWHDSERAMSDTHTNPSVKESILTQLTNIKQIRHFKL